ncbi:hypothetical protein BTVI_106446 [Pitangus sulphuratus]|nr:hypothetical protein BTVI_106446 [Pitangus sulphuratus]
MRAGHPSRGLLRQDRSSPKAQSPEASGGAEPAHAASLGSLWPVSLELGGGSHLVPMRLTKRFRGEGEECAKIRSQVSARKEKPQLEAAGKTRVESAADPCACSRLVEEGKERGPETALALGLMETRARD